MRYILAAIGIFLLFVAFVTGFASVIDGLLGDGGDIFRGVGVMVGSFGLMALLWRWVR